MMKPVTVAERPMPVSPPRCPFSVQEEDAIQGWWLQPELGGDRGGSLLDVRVGSVTTVTTPVCVREWGLHMSETAAGALDEGGAPASGRLWLVEGWGTADVDKTIEHEYYDCTGHTYAFECRRYLACVEYRDCFRRWLCDTLARLLRAHPLFRQYQEHADIQAVLAWTESYKASGIEQLQIMRRIAHRHPTEEFLKDIGYPFLGRLENSVLSLLFHEDRYDGIPAFNDMVSTELSSQDQSKFRNVMDYLNDYEVPTFRTLAQHEQECSNSVKA